MVVAPHKILRQVVVLVCGGQRPVIIIVVHQLLSFRPNPEHHSY
jgi:hypothetical protein